MKALAVFTVFIVSFLAGSSASSEEPASIDWRNIVTPVKKQGNCDASYAFAAVGAIEGQMARKTGYLESLSAQNLVDCSHIHSNRACAGGTIEDAYMFVITNQGVASDSAYPYTGQNGTCNNSTVKAGTARGFVILPNGNETALMTAISIYGPVAAAIDASHESFKSYKGGIYFEPKCNATAAEHGVLVVGYGTENDQDYWLVKNSFGREWGENGYVKIARGKGNHCGIATAASYPLI